LLSVYNLKLLFNILKLFHQFQVLNKVFTGNTL